MFLAFILNFTKQPKRNDNYIIYLLINLLICLCVMGKFSFNLIGFIVWVYSTINFVAIINEYDIGIANINATANGFFLNHGQTN